MNIYITNEANKMRLLIVLSKEKRFNNNKFYSFRKLKKKLIFDYNNKTIEYVMNKYNVNINIAKIYLENLYFLKDLEDNKVKFLNALKKDLDENNLLIYNKEFRKYLENKDITVYNKSKLSKEEKRILEGLNIRIENNLNNNYEPSIYEAENIEEEVEYVIRSIKELLCKNVDINNIKIIASKEYNKYLDYFCDLFGLPINIASDNTFYGTKIASKFLELYDNYEIDEIIDKLSDEENINDLITIVNKSVLVDDKYARKEFIINDLKTSKVKGVLYKNAIEIGSLDDYYSSDDYVYLIGCNKGIFPKVYNDDNFLSDKILDELDLDTSVEKNKLENKKNFEFIRNIPNLVITYNLFDGEKVKYPSNIIEELKVDVKKIEIDRRISYSKSLSNLSYAKDLDNLYKYNDEGKYLKMYQKNLNIPYKEYNNTYFKVDKALLKDSLESGITLSYTSLEMYNECSFKYFLNSIMKLNIFENTFKIVVGKIVHHILEIGLDKKIDIDLEISNFIKDLDFSFGPKELFYLHKITKELEFLLDYLEEQKKHSKLNEYLFEEEISIDKSYDGIDITFKGVIDKVMMTKYNDKEVIAVIDYKTGDKNIKLDTLEYGINIQLPIYLYLLKKSSRFKNSVIAGFYIEKVLNNCLNIDKNKSLETLKKENLRLQGYTNSNETIISLLDDNYLDSKMIKGLRFKNDGSFYSTSKVLSNEEMDKLIIVVDEIIDKVIKSIVNGDYEINPKVIKGKNIACEYCKFKDICYVTKEQELVLGGEEDELN
uniref:PD-(D/E)XK nuclease family protein n=1 Tax=Candidatus Onthocola sp. TaxID=3085646 RepID=UPI003FEECF3D